MTSTRYLIGDGGKRNPRRLTILLSHYDA